MMSPAVTFTEDPVDVLIIGGSHAGLSAAQTLYRQGHSSIIFDSGNTRSLSAWHGETESPLRLLPAFEGNSHQNLLAKARAELREYAGSLVQFEEVEIVRIAKTSLITTASKAEDDGFEVKDVDDRSWKGRKILFATGSKDILPDIPGYKECYPKAIFHCLFTYGIETQGCTHAGLLAKGVLSNPIHAAMLCADALKSARRLTVLTDGVYHLKPAIIQAVSEMQPGIEQLLNFDERKIAAFRLLHDPNKSIKYHDRITVIYAKEPDEQVSQTMDLDFVVHQPSTIASCPSLLAQVGLAVDSLRGDIQATNPFGGTEVPGVFVAGDCTSMFKIVPGVQFSGAAAGAGLARALGPLVVRQRFVKAGK